MLYYLTGMSTERSAVLAYNLLHAGVTELGETAVADTIVAPIRRQEPGHYAFYQMSARGLAASSPAGRAGWSARCAGSRSRPVGANNDQQLADFGELMETLASTADLESTSRARSPASSASCSGRGTAACGSADYVAVAFREAVELARAVGRAVDRLAQPRAPAPRSRRCRRRSRRASPTAA